MRLPTFFFILRIAASIFSLSSADAIEWDVIKTLRAKAGHTITLETNSSSVLWGRNFGKETDFLVHLENGVTAMHGLPPRIYLDTTTGSLTLSQLTPNDSGDYVADVTCPTGNVLRYKYILNVSEPDPIKTPDSTAQERTNDGRKRIAAAAAVSLSIFAVIVLVVLGLRKWANERYKKKVLLKLEPLLFPTLDLQDRQEKI